MEENSEKRKSKKPIAFAIGFLVGDGGFEPPKASPADLQSVPFGHSGNPPYTYEFGAGGRIRTPDLLITNQLLYQLSYTSTTTSENYATIKTGLCQQKSFVNPYFYKGREKENMTLQQLSYQYQEQAQALHQRIDLLRQAQARCGDRESAEHLQRRIRDLEPLHRQTRQLAELTARYYDRGYRKNAYYTL